MVTQPVATVDSLYLYPIKSCAGIAVNHLSYDPWGIVLDRRYVITDEQGKFITQREEPKLALIKPSVLPNGILELSWDTSESRITVLPSETWEKIQVWNHEGLALICNPEANQWLSSHLGKNVKIFHFSPGRWQRQSHGEILRPITFVDGSTTLLISRSSLTKSGLNADVCEKSFRPNIIIRDATPFAEDQWNSIQIGNIRFKKLRACSRCTIIDVDQRLGTRTFQNLQTLAKAGRNIGNKILMGVYFEPEIFSTISLGDQVSA